MFSSSNDQLSTIKIGVLLSEFITPNESLQTLDDIVRIVYDNLGVKIERGDRFAEILDRIEVAIKERDEMLAIGEQFYYDWLIEDELVQAMSTEICKEIDKDIIATLIGLAKETEIEDNFDNAMKGIQ